MKTSLISSTQFISVLFLSLNISTGCKTVKSDVQAVTNFAKNSEIDLTVYTIPPADRKKIFSDFKKELIQSGNDYDYLKSSIETYLDTRISDPVKNPAKKQVENGEIDIHELMAIHVYTTSEYTNINGPLRKVELTQIEKHQATIKAAASGLNKLKGQECKALRGTNLPDNFITALKQKNGYIEKAFMSTTTGDIPYAFRKSIEFTIKSKNCKDISWLSKYPSEDEVLFPPGSEFSVEQWNECPDGSRKLCFTIKHELVNPKEKRQSGVKKNLVVQSSSDPDEEPSPGTKAMSVKYNAAVFGGKTFFSEKNLAKKDNTKYVSFKKDGNGGEWVNTNGTNTITSWKVDTDSNLLEVKYKHAKTKSNTTAYFFAMDETAIGYMKGPNSQKVLEYYRTSSK